MMERDFGDLLICSMRYSIRRDTGMAIIIIGHIKKYWDRMRIEDRAQLVMEVRRELEFGDVPNGVWWRGFLEWAQVAISP